MDEKDNGIRYSDLIVPDNSINDLIKQLKDLISTYNEVLKVIKNEAGKVSDSIKGISGATKGGREAISEAAKDAERLSKAEKQLAFAKSDVAKELEKVKASQREINKINKLTIKYNESEEGSYNKLSAQYSLNTMKLNAMSMQQRQGTEEGKKLEEETNAIYQEMKRLQESTGKTTLNVGNYNEAAGIAVDSNKKLTTEIREMTEKLAMMRLAGSANTEEYRALSKRAGELKDALLDVTREVKNMASDTRNLDYVMSGITAASGGFTAVTGALTLFGGESENVAEAQKKLQSVMSITIGLSQLQTQLQKQSALMLGINKIQVMALTKAKELENAITNKTTVSTIAATAAQKIFNAVAKANPYVLLALALVSVVGALTAFAFGSNKAAKQQKILNELNKENIKYLKEQSDKLKENSDKNIKAIEGELKLLKLRGASLKETRALEDKLNAEKIKSVATLKGYYSSELKNIDNEKNKLNELKEVLHNVTLEKAAGKKKIKVDLDLNGKIEKYKIDKAIEILQGEVENQSERVKILTDIEIDDQNLKNQLKEITLTRINENKELQKKEVAISQNTEDLKIAILADGYEKQRTQLNAEYNRKIADLKFQLANDFTLTTKSKSELNKQVILLRKEQSLELAKIDKEEKNNLLQLQRDTEDLRIGLIQDENEREQKILDADYKRKVQDKQNQLANDKALTVNEQEEIFNQIILLTQDYANKTKKINEKIKLQEIEASKDAISLKLDTIKQGTQEELDLRLALIEKEREQELLQNSELSENLRQNELDINKKYDNLIFQERTSFLKNLNDEELNLRQSFEKSKFDLTQHSQAQETIFILEQEKERLKNRKENLEELLQATQDYGDNETAMIIATLENQINAINEKEEAARRPESIWQVMGLGLDSKQESALNDAVGKTMGYIEDMMASYQKEADQNKATADQKVKDAEEALNKELELREKGLANNVEGAEKNLEVQKRYQKKAADEQEKYRKINRRIQLLEQTTNLITASAKIWGALGSIPPLAISAIALMWASFLAAKIKAATLVNQNNQESGEQKYSKGTVELLEGGSHESGNDVFLGITKKGKKRKAEGGEYLAIFNKENSKRYKKVIPNLVNNINKGTLYEFINKNINYDTKEERDKKYISVIPEIVNPLYNGTSTNKYIDAYKKINVIQPLLKINENDIGNIANDVNFIKNYLNKKHYINTTKGVIMEYKNLRREIN